MTAMTAGRLAMVAGVASAMAATAGAQQYLAFTTDDSDSQGNRPIDAGVAVNSEAVVTTSNIRVTLFDPGTGAERESWHITDTGFPFRPSYEVLGTPVGILFDPRSEYDVVNAHIWMMYAERFGQPPVAAIHLAVSRPDAAFDSFDEDNFYYYTGTGATAGNGGAAYDLMSSQIPQALRFQELPDFPSFNVDDKAVYLFPNDITSRPYCAAVIVPLTHDGGTKSILDGERPDEGDITILRLDASPSFDTSLYHYAVQEPFDQFAAAQFVVATTDAPWVAGLQD